MSIVYVGFVVRKQQNNNISIFLQTTVEETTNAAVAEVVEKTEELAVAEPEAEVVIVQPRPLPPPGHRDGRVAVLVTPGRGSHCAQLGDAVMRPEAVAVVIVVAETSAVVVQLIILENADNVF